MCGRGFAARISATSLKECPEGRELILPVRLIRNVPNAMVLSSPHRGIIASSLKDCHDSMGSVCIELYTIYSAECYDLTLASRKPTKLYLHASAMSRDWLMTD